MTTSKLLRSSIVAGSLFIFVFAAVMFARSSGSPTNDELLRMIPAESLFCVRVNNLDQTLGQTDQFLTGVSPAPMWLSTMIRGHLAKLLGSPELNGVNMNGGFAVFGTISPGEPLGDDLISILIPVTDYQQLISENPNITQPDANGVSKMTSGPILIQVGNFALLKWQKCYDKLIETAKSMSSASSAGLASVLDDDELNKAMKEPIWAFGNIQLASKTFGPMLLSKIEEVKKIMEQNKEKGQMPMGDPAAIMDMYAGVLDLLMKETKSLNVTVTPKPDVLNITSAISAVPGTDMADMFTADAPAKENKLLNYLEDGAVMNVSGQITGKLNAEMMDFFATMLTKDMNEVEAAKIKSFASDFADVFSGNDAMSFSVDPNNKPPFTFKYVIGIKDKEKLDKLIEQGTELFNTGGIADFYKSFGMKTSFETKRGVDNYKGFSIDSAKFTIKSTEPNSPQGQMINALYGEGFEYRWTLVNGMLAAVMGENIDAAMYKLIDEVKAGGPKELAGEIKSALTLIPDADQADFVGTYNFLRYFKILGSMMPVPTPFPQMDISTKSNIAFAGKIGQVKMTFEIALPKEHLLEMMGMFQKMQQQQQEQQKTIQPSAKSTPRAGVSSSSLKDETDSRSLSGEVPLQGPAAAVVREYLVAATKLDPSETRIFLSKKCGVDIVTEFQANARSGWTCPNEYITIVNEVINTPDGEARVKAKVVFKGGDPPTFMMKELTFLLVLEDGVWKISGMDPLPRRASLGVMPLSR